MEETDGREGDGRKSTYKINMTQNIIVMGTYVNH